MIGKLNLISEETAREIEAMIRKAMPEEYSKTRQSRHPIWVIVQCNSDFALTTTNPDGSQRDQLYPATIIQASAGQIYPPQDIDRADLYGSPVLLTVIGGNPGISGTNTDQNKPVVVRPKRGRLYVGILCGEVELDKSGFLLSISGRSRVVAVDIHEFPGNWKGFVRAADVTFFSGAGVNVASLTVGGVSGFNIGDRIGFFGAGVNAGIAVVGNAGGTVAADDFDNVDEMTGATVVVTDGDFAGTMWECVTQPPITLGVTPIVWRQVNRTQWKQPVRFLSGSTGVTAGTVVDGVTAVAGDRHLAWSVGLSARIYVVQASGSPHLAFDGYNDAVMDGAVVLVRQGTVSGGVAYKLKHLGGSAFDMTPFSISGGPGTNGRLTAWSGVSTLRDTGVTEGSGVLAGPGWVIGNGGSNGLEVHISAHHSGTPVGDYDVILGTGFGGAQFGPGIAFGRQTFSAGEGNMIYTGLQGFSGGPMVLAGALSSSVMLSVGTTIIGIGKFGCLQGLVYGDGVTGVLGPGCESVGGIVSNLGTGTFLTSGANTFTGTQTINSPTAPALNVQQTSSNASDTIRVRNIAGTTTFAVTGNGDVAASGNMAVVGTITSTAGFSGPGGSLTGLNATQLTSGTIPNARYGAIDMGAI